METEGREAPNLLAFMALYLTSAGDGFMGAILVTDQQGVPQEFRCTHPVRPTTIQKPHAAKAPRRTRIDSSTGKFQPIMVETHPEFPEDASAARDLLERAFVHLDPVEPFERMETALRVLGKEDSRFQ